MLRTLNHYWRINVAVVLGAAVATAVLTGALLVGDSVRGSLRDLTLDRLGRVQQVVLADRLFTEALAARLAPEGSAAPAILLRGSATHAETGARASGIGILGVDERFASLFEDSAALDLVGAPAQPFPSAVLNRSLAGELGADAGDVVVLSFGGYSQVPRDTLMGDTDVEDVLETLRVRVAAVLPDRGAGRFGLAASQQTPLNAFVALSRIQRTLDQRDRANTILAAGEDEIADRLAAAVSPEDLGLRLVEREAFVSVASDEFVLRPAVDEALGRILDAAAVPYQRTQSYLANAIVAGERSVPYSLVAALDPRPDWPWASLSDPAGTAFAAIPEDGILINEWTAADLDVSIGDPVELVFYVVGAREELREERTTLRVHGIVRMTGLGADRDLTPDYPGIRDAADMSAWDPPFPVDLDRIRPRDEAYWDDFGPTPKAFVAEATGRRLWSTRYGSTTSIRFSGLSPTRFLSSVRDELPPESFGLRVRPVRSEGLAAARGATDFAGLFIGFSLFLIVSATMLVGQLFRLGVEQRAGEVGLLLAVGYRVARVRRRLLAEGLLLSVAGSVVGLAGAVGYAASMMAGLRRLWLPAVGSSELYLHVVPASLALGFAISVVVVQLSVVLAVRKLVRVAPQRLLAGSWTTVGRGGASRATRWIAGLALVGGAALVVGAAARNALASPGVTFGAGVLLLVGGLAAFSAWCRRSRHGSIGASGIALASMAARNSCWNPGRSILSVALVASAVFVIAAVAANREDVGHDAERRDSGTGGFLLMAETDVPIHQDLNDGDGRFTLGFTESESRQLAGVHVVPFRQVPGDDASCLNLYQPEKPRLLGVPDELIRRGGFRFQQQLALAEGQTSAWSLLDPGADPDVVPALADFNSAMWILKKQLGDEISLEDEFGRPLRLRLVGLLASSIFQSELLISERALLRHFPGRSGDSYFLIDVPAEQLDATAQLLESRLASFGLDATPTAVRLARYKVVEHTYLSTFQLLGGLGLILGTVGLGVILLRNVIERRGELAVLRAFGFRRRRLGWLVVAENAFLLVVGTGIGSIAAMLAAAPRLATIQVPWLSLAGTLALVLAIGLLSSVAAVRGALRAPLLPALKAER